jgi:hypothetical protein
MASARHGHERFAPVVSPIMSMAKTRALMPSILALALLSPACPGSAPVVATPDPATSTSSTVTKNPEVEEPKKAADRSDLDASIDVAISMLTSKAYREFLLEFVSPQDREAFDKKGGIDAILPEFASDKAEKLLALLRKLHGVVPERNGAKARFEVKDEKTITWILVDAKWYIMN